MVASWLASASAAPGRAHGSSVRFSWNGDPREMVDLLGLEPVDQVTAELEACAVGLADLLALDTPDPAELVAAFVAALPTGD